MTSLHLAARFGSLELAKVILSKISQDPTEIARAVNRTDEVHETPISAASLYGHTELVTFLLSRGADPNTHVDKTKSPVLHAATICGHEHVVSALLDGGADINGVDSEGRTATSRCRTTRQLPILRLLLARGADVDKPDMSGITPLMMAVIGSEFEVLEALLDANADLEARDVCGSTALLICAAQDDALRITQVLLRRGANPNVRNRNGDTALSASVKSGHSDVTRLLIQAGADIGWQDEVGETLMHVAAGAGRQAMVEVLLDAGAAIDARDAVQATPLCNAIAGEHDTVADLLVERGADPTLPFKFRFIRLSDGQGQFRVIMAHVEDLDIPIQDLLDAFHRATEGSVVEDDS